MLLDEGSNHFKPSDLEITGEYTENSAQSVVTESVHVKINDKFVNNRILGCIIEQSNQPKKASKLRTFN